MKFRKKSLIESNKAKMAMVKFDKVVSVNSEAQGHNAQNLLNPEVNVQKSWLCEKGTDKAIVILQLERAAVISAIHVGNAHSAFVEVLVGRASDASDQYESLLPMSTFMNPNESKTGKNPNQVRFFSKTDFEEKAANKQWDRVKVVCSQPFNKLVPFGLCFIKVLGEKEPGSEAKKPLPLPMLKDDDSIEIGSFFKKKKEFQGSPKQELSVSEQIRKAEKPEALSKHTPISTSKLTAKMSEKHSEKGKRKTKRKDKDEDDDEEQSDNRKNRDLGLEDEDSTPKKPKLDNKKGDDKKGKESAKKKTEPKKERKKKEASEKNKPKKPFNKLMDDVVFVISGFKNPIRGTIRAKAMDMGAQYEGDWNSKCTHLICAYENTPKFNQVKGTGKIIKKDWIEKCHEDRRRYPWRRYALDEDDRKQNESEDEIIADDASSKPGDDIPSSSNAVTRDEGKRTPAKQGSGEERYDVATDDEEDKKEDTTSYPMPFLPDVFSMKTFYVDSNIPNRATIERYIIAYNGIITENLNGDVEFYITNTGGPALEIFHKKAPNFIAVKPSWIWEINAQQQWIPTSQFLVK